MKNNKHTPGPWLIEEGDDDECYHIYSPDDGIGTMYIAKDIDQGKDHGLADAKLIAAAPDLLEACKALIDADHYEHFAVRLNDQEMEGLNKIKAAIKKATK
jgi:hypothetical protein